MRHLIRCIDIQAKHSENLEMINDCKIFLDMAAPGTYNVYPLLHARSSTNRTTLPRRKSRVHTRCPIIDLLCAHRDAITAFPFERRYCSSSYRPSSSRP